MPAAHTDGDSLVWFRHADVIADRRHLHDDDATRSSIWSTAAAINGVIDALNKILELAFPDFRLEGGTMIVPGHGRLCDSADVAYYRDMVTIVRDRVQDMIKKGMTLEQVKAAKPTRDYDRDSARRPVRGRPTCSSTRSTRRSARKRSSGQETRDMTRAMSSYRLSSSRWRLRR